MVKSLRKKPTRKRKIKITRKNKLRKKGTFKKLKCSPNQKNIISDELKDTTCYSNEQLQLFKNIWNENNKNNLINTNNPLEIWSFLKHNLNNKCSNELCWLNDVLFNSKINKDVIKKEIFKPFSPKSWKKKPNAWLSSIDIVKVMRQYEKRHKNFVFIGPSPIDFDNKKLFSTCVWEKLCKFNLSNYLNSKPRKNKIGIIFNLDPHDKPGSHWVALFIDVKKNFIFYFDSNGDGVPNEVQKLVVRIQDQALKLNINLDFDTNEGFIHQKKDGQCGIYTLYFIIELLKETKTYMYFKKHKIPDKIMRQHRNKYYN
tara:strand:- start:518 stop:1459 length:942 start_codon:yes stop_codon:yes gene_type:complete